MTLHVDLLRTDWRAHLYRRVALFELNGVGVRVVGPEADVWRERLLHTITSRTTGEPLDPGSAPKDWLEELGRQIKGDYLFALAHPEEECPINLGTQTLTMPRVPVADQPT